MSSISGLWREGEGVIILPAVQSGTQLDGFLADSASFSI